MAKKSKGEEPAGGGNVMDTWADMMSLLMCFFLLLYAFSNVDAGKFEALSGSLVNAFNGVGGVVPVVIPGMSPDEIAKNAIDDPFWPTATSPTEPFEDEDGDGDGDGDGDQATEPPDSTDPGVGDGTGSGDVIFAEIVGLFEDFLEIRGIGGEVLADYATFSLIIRFNDSILFDSGIATLRAEALNVLDGMADIISDMNEVITMVRVEGHTDNVPLAGNRFEDNLELSCIRAVNATRYIQHSGKVDETKIYAAGYGEHMPIGSNDTPEGRQMNRRVDFVIESLNLSALDRTRGLGGS